MDHVEDEAALAQARGMNAYAAALILHHVDLDTLVAMGASSRTARFAGLVGARRIVSGGCFLVSCAATGCSSSAG
jgi:hypothetical protein